MATNILYIIGNGFDLYHGIKSKYTHFKEYLTYEDADLIRKLEENFDADLLWSNFEETLAHLDTDNIVEEAEIYLVSYGTSNWKDSYHHDYQYEVQNQIDVITVQLKQKFLEWMLQLRIPDNNHKKPLIINHNATFLNFNYTNSLEKIYKVPHNKIFYIHNKAIDINSNLILGHSRDPDKMRSFNYKTNTADQDVRITQANLILDSYFKETYKSTKKVIEENVAFFSALANINEIHILGHSLAVVDMGYFKEILKWIDINKVKWKISFYDNNELLHHKQVMNDLGINQDLIDYDRLDFLYTKQIELFNKPKL
ncbi:MAG TPA: bacteriophage abortive infection AbiH family protein [Ferruginibacter sp.]|jgi:hypothetical protein|nr:bacteriophage abortive infection AbiH family protein [Ferruginibacter sp.]